jgi:hypothetical protein
MRSNNHVKIFYSSDSSKLESKINNWLTEDGRPIILRDIKFSSSISSDSEGIFDSKLYSALILYCYSC